uniref:(California timema) hypothetical protein n=1 Tax=Timema californicum TaxID=61474 RepID=A0A7R9PAE1_TIMCA|nr:unnamed protein product [Timema californicum]
MGLLFAQALQAQIRDSFLKRKKKSIGVRKWIGRRVSPGPSDNLLKELAFEDPQTYRQVVRLSWKKFDELLKKVHQFIMKPDKSMKMFYSSRISKQNKNACARRLTLPVLTHAQRAALFACHSPELLEGLIPRPSDCPPYLDSEEDSSMSEQENDTLKSDSPEIRKWLVILQLAVLCCLEGQTSTTATTLWNLGYTSKPSSSRYCRRPLVIQLIARAVVPVPILSVSEDLYTRTRSLSVSSNELNMAPVNCGFSSPEETTATPEKDRIVATPTGSRKES